VNERRECAVDRGDVERASTTPSSAASKGELLLKSRELSGSNPTA